MTAPERDQGVTDDGGKARREDYVRSAILSGVLDLSPQDLTVREAGIACYVATIAADAADAATPEVAAAAQRRALDALPMWLVVDVEVAPSGTE